MPFGQSDVCPIRLMNFSDHLGKGNVDLTAVILTAEQVLRGLDSFVDCKLKLRKYSLWSNGERCSDVRNRLPCFCYLKSNKKKRSPLPPAPQKKKKERNKVNKPKNQKGKQKKNNQNNKATAGKLLWVSRRGSMHSHLVENSSCKRVGNKCLHVCIDIYIKCSTVFFPFLSPFPFLPFPSLL